NLAAKQRFLGQEINPPPRGQAKRDDVEIALVIRDEQNRSSAGDATAAVNAEAVYKDHQHAADPVQAFVKKIDYAGRHRRTSRSRRSMTSSTVMFVVSITMASSAGTIGAKSRLASRKSRASCSASTDARSISWPRCRNSSQRRRARSFRSAWRKNLHAA